ncbi:hypothetical protein ABB29_09575 [Pseudoxanthomonas dokdonensis]|uniref:O-antigen ligase-related domain-containing protein n=1 Tax=Pseudoxanthomonas dokdonensis TaxID=344882 RepID=A0A0R0CIF4_9GAMM|nr:hypothetical protein ABB29_09575 [Pseudoxanthomonas dokdonensis]
MREPSTAGRLFFLATIAAPALILIPKGLAVFALLLLLATLLSWKSSNRPSMALPATWVRAAWLLAVLPLAIAALSVSWFNLPWSELGKIARLLLLPWCAWLAWRTASSRNGLWWGALAGVLVAFCVALLQTASGIERANAGGNPITFANLVLMLLVLAVFCRPRTRDGRTLTLLLAVLAMGIASIVMSGSRGVLPGLALVLLLGLVGKQGRRFWIRMGVSLAALSLLCACLLWVPSLSSQSRLANIAPELARYERGDGNSSVGARLELWSRAWEALRQHPLTGTGLRQFDRAVVLAPECASSAPPHWCRLRHAHNDLFEWAATMGVPGGLALILIYLLPALFFLRCIGRAPPGRMYGAAWAGLVMVLAFASAGLSQSMFAHAASATAYALFIGCLAGIALNEQRQPASTMDATRAGR